MYRHGLIDLAGGIGLAARSAQRQQGKEEKRRRTGGKNLSAFPPSRASMRKDGDAEAVFQSCECLENQCDTDLFWGGHALC
nr:hypothetical protein [Pseudomonas sp. ZH-FAD]